MFEMNIKKMRETSGHFFCLSFPQIASETHLVDLPRKKRAARVVVTIVFHVAFRLPIATSRMGIHVCVYSVPYAHFNGAQKSRHFL